MKKKLDKKAGIVVSWLHLPDGWICSGVSGGGTQFLRLASVLIHQVPPLIGITAIPEIVAPYH